MNKISKTMLLSSCKGLYVLTKPDVFTFSHFTNKRLTKLTFYITFLLMITSQACVAQFFDNIENLQSRTDSLIFRATKDMRTAWEVPLEQMLLAEQFALKENNQEQLFKIYEGLAWINVYHTNLLSQGFQYRHKQYEAAKNLKDTIKIVDALQSIGSTYYKFNILDKAETYYLEADALVSKTNDIRRTKLVYIDLINHFKEVGKEEEMLRYFEKVTTLLNKETSKDDDFVKIAKYLNVAEFYVKNGDGERGLEYLEKTRGVIRQHPNRSPFLPIIWMFKSRLYYEANNPEMAVIYGDSAVRNFRGYSNFYPNSSDFYNSYSSSLVQLGKKDDALELLKVLNVKNDSVLNHKLYSEGVNASLLNKVEERASTLEKEQQVTVLALEKVKKRNLLFLFITVLALLSVLLFRMQLKKNKLKTKLLQLEQEKAQHTISQKNREVISKLLHLANTQNTLDLIANDLTQMDLDPKANPEALEKRQAILSTIKASKNKGFWIEFEKRFEEIHPDFYHNLNEKHGNLSRSDQHLSAFLKLNLNTKEIAQITGNNAKSIEVKRSRLRKKIGIAHKNINLNIYLQSI